MSELVCDTDSIRLLPDSSWLSGWLRLGLRRYCVLSRMMFLG